MKTLAFVSNVRNVNLWHKSWRLVQRIEFTSLVGESHVHVGVLLAFELDTISYVDETVTWRFEMTNETRARQTPGAFPYEADKRWSLFVSA